LDKNDTSYVYVKLDGENESKVKSTNQLVSAAGIRKKFSGYEPSIVRRHSKDVLVFWLLTPVGWLIYKYFTDEDFKAKYFAANTSQSMKFWNIGFVLTHAISFGVLGPLLSIPLAIKQKRLLVSIFAIINLIGVSVFIVGIGNTPDGGTLPTIPTVFFIINYIIGFFFPLYARAGRKDSSPEQA
jgi:hypothetical protein